jgi:hypothetical protein
MARFARRQVLQRLSAGNGRQRASEAGKNKTFDGALHAIPLIDADWNAAILPCWQGGALGLVPLRLSGEQRQPPLGAEE